MKKTGNFIILNLTIVMFITLAMILIRQPVFAASDNPCYTIKGNNIDDNNYTHWFFPIESYLTKCGNQYMALRYTSYDRRILATYYDEDFRPVRHVEIPSELDFFTGFYESADNYYIVARQNNLKESDDVETFRIIKYDKNWNRLGTCSIYRGSIYQPACFGSCRMEMNGKYLEVRSCYTMYGGMHHQSTVAFQVDTTKMDNSGNYKLSDLNYRLGVESHSFNQFVRMDGPDKMVTVDHTDRRPYGVRLHTYSYKDENGAFLNFNVTETKFIEIPDPESEDDYNNTGISVGALEIGRVHYLVAGNSVFRYGTDTATLTNQRTRNIFVSSVDKTTDEVTTKWFTDTENGGDTSTTPYLVKIEDNKYMLLWTRGEYVEYTLIDESCTKLTKTYQLKGFLSDCAPVLLNGRVVWFTWEDSEETFYTISASDLDDTEVINTRSDHDYELLGVENGVATRKCSKCGDVLKGMVPTWFSVYWRLEGSSDTHYYPKSDFEVDLTDRVLFMCSNRTYEEETVSNYFNDITFDYTGPDDIVYDGTHDSIKFRTAGDYVFTFYPLYNPDVKRTYTIHVAKTLERLYLSTGSGRTQEYGKEIGLTAAAEGGHRDLTYAFYIKKESGPEIEIQRGKDSVCNWTPDGTGNYTVRAVVIDNSDSGKQVSSNSISFTITKAERPFVLPPAEITSASKIETLTNDLLSGCPGWVFDNKDIGTPLNVGETRTFTAYYTGEDKDYFSTLTSDVIVTRSSCAHDGGLRVEGAVNATCLSEGWTGDKYCKLCGELIESGTVIPLDPNNHVHTTWTAAKPATTTSPGYTESRVCNDCGTVIVASRRIPPTNQSSDPSFFSEEDGEDWDDWYDEVIDLPAVKITKPKARKKSCTVKWKKLNKKYKKKIQGIEIQIASDPGFTQIVKSTTAGKKKTSKVVKGLKSKTTYYVRVRAYKNAADCKHVSAWKTKKVKIK